MSDYIPTITYAVTVCNELKELTNLLNFLHNNKSGKDEILIQYDSNKVTKEIIDYLNIVKIIHGDKVVGFPLNNDFSAFKNNLKREASGLFIFQLDADELPNKNLIENVHTILDMNNEVDVFMVPRINTVRGITEEHVKKWGWSVSKLETQVTKRILRIDSPEFEYIKKLDYIIDMEPVDSDVDVKLTYYSPIINFPDVQLRLYRRLSEIEWTGKVHERIIGYNIISALPLEEDYSLYHHKDIQRQEQQNNYYTTL
jgi:hypothetical protein